MARFVQQGTLGYRDVSGGASDYNCTHVILTKAEYDNIYEKIHKLEYDKMEIQENCEKTIEKYLQSYEESVRAGIERGIKRNKEQNEKLLKKIYELKNDLETAAEERDAETQRADEAEELNANLIRIARERANQEQNIRPKKQKYGYKILSKREYTQKYDNVYTIDQYNDMPYEWQKEHPRSRNSEVYVEHMTATVWKSVLTTPYKATLKKEEVEQLIFRDLKKCRYDMGIFAIHHTNGKYVRYYNKETRKPVNTLYKWELVDDYSRGYWQIEIYTTDELDDHNGGTW